MFNFHLLILNQNRIAMLFFSIIHSDVTLTNTNTAKGLDTVSEKVA